MSSTPREIGTLIVVVLKANHLPNKRHIGKQDPYCVVTVNGEKRRTKAIKRGGQHPEWDEEIRFTLYEDTDDVLARAARHDGTPPALPPKDTVSQRKIKGGKTMKLSCYADDIREPDLIGEADVNLTEVLTKGETDEWFTLTNKDKFAGKVYLELTFWSNEPPPEKKVQPKPKNSKQYGGPGSFVPSGEQSAGHHPSRSTSVSGSYSSPAQLDLYVAPYEQRNQANQIDNLAQDFSEFGVHQGRRRESFPPIPMGYSHQPLSNYGGYLSEGSVAYTYDRPPSPNSQVSAFHGSPNSYGYQSSYDANAPLAYQSTIRGPRHSVPTSSSGFMPLQQQSGFVPMQTPLVENGAYGSPVSHTPAPMGYTDPSQFVTQLGYPPQNQPSPVNPYLTSSISGPVSYQQSLPSSQSYPYQQYSIPASVSAPQQQYIHTQPALPAQATGAPPQGYQTYQTASPSHDSLGPLPQVVNPPPNGPVGGSRPLPPQPQIIYAQPPPMPQQISAPPPPPLNNYSPPQQQGNLSPGPLISPHPLPIPPPPPPPPLLHYNTEPQTFVSSGASQGPGSAPPPVLNGSAAGRQSSLPQPPTSYQQSSSPYQPPPNHAQTNDGYGYGQLPPPPPPPLHSSGIHLESYQPVSPLPPPPKPPAPIDTHGQWTTYNQ